MDVVLVCKSESAKECLGSLHSERREAVSQHERGGRGKGFLGRDQWDDHMAIIEDVDKHVNTNHIRPKQSLDTSASWQVVANSVERQAC